jgi:hypothetical protein
MSAGDTSYFGFEYQIYISVLLMLLRHQQSNFVELEVEREYQGITLCYESLVTRRRELIYDGSTARLTRRGEKSGMRCEALSQVPRTCSFFVSRPSSSFTPLKASLQDGIIDLQQQYEGVDQER